MVSTLIFMMQIYKLIFLVKAEVLKMYLTYVFYQHKL